MTVRITDAGDRVHIITPALEWTILRGFVDGRGPCYISDVRERAKPYRQLIRDGGLGHTINDPHVGGLFGFGLVAARPGPDGLDPATFWDHAWELTTRLDAGPRETFGIGRPWVKVHGETVTAGCEINLDTETVCELGWAYSFGPGDEVACTLGIVPVSAPGVWIKEPKWTANGLLGYESLVVENLVGAALETIDLTRYRNPQRHTKNVTSPDRCRYVFSGPDRPTLTITDGRQLDLWRQDADQLPPLSTDAIRANGSFGPADGYCLGDGHLLNQAEVTRWAAGDVCGLLGHGWPGGYGAPDCWNTFRPWPTRSLTLKLAAAFG